MEGSDAYKRLLILYNRIVRKTCQEDTMRTNFFNTNDTESHIPEGTHVTIHSFMRREMELNRIEIWVFAVIYGFFMNGLTFCGSRQYLADWAGCGLTSIDTAIAALLKKGYIRRISNHGRYIEYTVRVENLPDIPTHRGMIKLSKA